MRLVFATNNMNKIKEVQSLIPSEIELLSLKDIGCFEDVPETQNTIEGNAKQKAEYIKTNYNYDCFADDTGLEIEALNNAPGVFSARYAGEQKDSNDNMDLVLANLKNETNRKARFRTVISLIIDGKEQLFEGEAKGEIIKQKCGVDGFGYDPIFKPEGHDITFAEMNMSQKNEISHRGKAVRKLVEYLAQL